MVDFTMLFFLAMIVLLGCAGLATAQTAARNNYPLYNKPVKLNFTTNNAPTIYNKNLNVTGIQNTIRQSGSVIAGLHKRALGLTSS